jgi:hypothetical protein
MTKEEIIQAAQDWDGSGMATPAEEGAFVAGAEWMREEMIENPDGGALLYAVEKTAERTKREMIEKAVKWMYNYFVIDHFSMTSAGFGVFELAFKQAMQDESK